MKKLLFAFLLALPFVAAAQQAPIINVREIVASDRNKAAGCEGPYRYDAAPQTPAPKGYAPFYISHYGRHGSRYAWNDDTYTVIRNVLQAAKDAGSLTETGELFYDRYMDFYKIPLINYGDLTELGREQHWNIAAEMCARFPEVFADGGKFLARSSTSPRAITSMSAFCASVQKSAPKAEVVTNSLHTNMCVINPPEAPDELFRDFEGKLRPIDGSALADMRTKHYDDILGRFFSDRGFLEEIGGRKKFIDELFMLWSGYHNYCSEDLFEFVFSDEEIVDFWEYENYRLYLSHSSDRYLMIPLLEDIIDNAQAAIGGSEWKGHFRFGHDTVLNAIIPLLNLNGSGYQPERSEEVKYWFQNFNVPKAANIQFVLYKSKKNPEVLFKVLLNGSEATLPQLEPVSGPYYRWTDFVYWAQQVFAAHPSAVAANTTMLGFFGSVTSVAPSTGTLRRYM